MSVLTYASSQGGELPSELSDIGDEADASTRLYTSNVTLGAHEFYKHVNGALLSDSTDALPALAKYLQKTNHFLLVTAHVGNTVYRGIDLTGHWADYPPGGRIRLASYTSASAERAVADRFGPHMIEIEIPPNHRGARDIRALSEFPDEAETLFVPYSLFDVVSVDQSAGVVRLRAV
jgi:hypothetical protein